MVSPSILYLTDWKIFRVHPSKGKSLSLQLNHRRVDYPRRDFLYSNCKIQGNPIISLQRVYIMGTSSSLSPLLVLQKVVFHLEKGYGPGISLSSKRKRLFEGGLGTNLAQESMVFIYDGEHLVFALWLHHCITNVRYGLLFLDKRVKMNCHQSTKEVRESA